MNDIYHEQVFGPILGKRTFQHVEGWLSENEGQFLAEQARDKVCLEIGSYKGKSTCYMAQFAKKVYALDPFGAGQDGQAQDGETLRAFTENTKEFKNIRVVKGLSQDMADTWPNMTFDLIFIDGLHTYEQVKQDINLYWPKLKPYGIMAFHDFISPNEWPGVYQAVTEAFGTPKTVDTIAYVQRYNQAVL